MPQFKVLTPIVHNQESYAVDETVEMSEKQSKPLLEMQAIAPVNKEIENSPPAEDPLIPQMVMTKEEPEDPKTAPPSTARKQQQKGGE